MASDTGATLLKQSDSRPGGKHHMATKKAPSKRPDYAADTRRIKVVVKENRASGGNNPARRIRGRPG